ncbi:MAG: hypothetical protein HY909_21425 [Deltaproteobacteria bacterium]|nr:hypothetical protein [Deltaproteobacteria bacterium]
MTHAPLCPFGRSRWLGVFVLGMGCAGGPEAPSPTQVTQPLNGTATYGFLNLTSGCSAAEKATIDAAMALLDDQVNNNPEPLRSCLRDAVLSPDDGESVSTIMPLLQQNMHTDFTCQDAATNPCGGSTTWLACASVGIPDEEVRIDHGYLASGTVAQIAASILHEIAHNKGFRHLSGTEDPYAVTDQLNTCSRVLSASPAFGGVTVPTTPTGGARSQWQGESELQQVGGAQGSPFLGHYCAPDDLVAGQALGLAFNGLTMEVGSLALRCRNRFTNVITQLGTVGVGLPPSTTDCPAGEVVVGVTGHADTTKVSSLGLHCAPRTQVLAGNNAVTTVLPELGTALGTSFQRFCPTGMAMSAMHGRVGSSLEQLRVVCRTLGQTPPPSPSALATAGSTVGTSSVRDRELCSDLGAMTGLYGRTGLNPVTTSLLRFGGRCRGMERVGGVLGVRAGSVEHLTPGSGGEGGNGLTALCPAGQALIGVRSFAGPFGERSDVDGRCASITAWDGVGAAPITTIVPFNNVGLRGASVTSDCPRGSFLVGFEVGSSVINPLIGSTRVVDRITPICRDL